MKYLNYIFIFLAYFNVSGQSNTFFQHTVVNASCDEEDGILILIVNDLTISSYPLPYYVELSQEGGADRYYDLDDTEFTFDGLGKGNYSMRIWLDYENGCKVDIPFEVGEEELPLPADITFNCQNGCADLQINSANGPYEVNWLLKEKGLFKAVTGWPKYNLSGTNNQEDLCNVNTSGEYKVVVYDMFCGKFEQTIAIDPCACFDVNLVHHKNVSFCEVPDVYPTPPPTQSCDGKIEINVTGNTSASILWSTGATTNKIENLCTGIYSVTVISNGCSKVSSYEVCCCTFNAYNHDGGNLYLCTSDGSHPTLDINLQAIHPSSSNSFDGSISLSFTGGTNTMAYKWEGPNNFKSNKKDITNLQSGLYSVTVTDGCNEKSKQILLQGCSDIVYLTDAKVFNTCLGASIGSIELTLAPNVEIVWDMPNNPTGSLLSNLGAGTYCGNLTHKLTKCKTTVCYDVLNATPITNIEINQLVTTCPNEKSGFLSYRFLNTGLRNYSVNLFNLDINSIIDINSFIKNTETPYINGSFSNLEKGNYRLLLFSNCDLYMQDFVVGEDVLDIDYSFEIGCNNNSSINIIASGTNPPFNYSWSPYLPALPNQTKLKRGIYHVTVTDNRGCKKDTVIKEISPIFEIVSQTKACIGLWDGSITIKVNNPNNEFVELTYAYGPGADNPNFPIAVADNFANPIIFTLSDLSGNTEYEVRAFINGCYEVLKFTIGEQQSEREFSKFENLGDDKILCIYDEICKDNRWEDNIEEPATLVAEAGKCEGIAAGVLLGLFSDCGKFEFFCDNDKVHEKEVGTTLVRVGEWIEWMISIGKDPLDYELGDPCSYVRVCENMPDCQAGGENWNWTGGTMVDQIPMGNGCVKIICESGFFLIPAPDYIICGLDFLPDYVPFHYDPWPAKECKRVTKKFAEIIAFKNELTLKYDTLFTKSSLYKQILKYESDQRRHCADITFCLCNTNDCEDHFKFESTDILDVRCDVFEPPCIFGNYLVGASCVPYGSYTNQFSHYTYCKKDDCDFPSGTPGCDCLEPRLLNLEEFNKFSLFRYNDLPDIVQFRTKLETRFERFSKTKLVSNYYTSDAIFSTNTRTHFYHTFNTDRWEYNTNHTADFVYQDYTTKKGMMIKRNDPYSYSIFNTQYGQTPTTFNYGSVYSVENSPGSNVGSYTNLNVTGLSTYQNNYLVSGSTDTSYFKVILNNTNSVTRKQTVSGFKDSTYIVTGKGFSTFVTKTPGSKIKINNITTTSGFTTKSSLITIKDTYNGGVDITEIVSWVKTNRLVKVEENFATGQDTYIFIGNGGLDFGTTQIPESTIESIYLITYKKGVIYWKILPIPVSFSENIISLASDNDGNIFVGINFRDNYKTTDFNLNSYGNTDIVLLKYDKFGLFLGYKHYGSEDNEILKDIYLDSNILHLGGDVEGQSKFRKIGDLTFAKFDTLASHAFISFTSSEDFSTNTIQNRIPAQIVEPSSFTLTPNPTNSMVEIMLDNPVNQELKVNINNMEGKTIFTTILTKNEFNNKHFVLQLSDLPSGVYSVSLMTNHRIIDTKKLIKI